MYMVVYAYIFLLYLEAGFVHTDMNKCIYTYTHIVCSFIGFVELGFVHADLYVLWN